MASRTSIIIYGGLAAAAVAALAAVWSSQAPKRNVIAVPNFAKTGAETCAAQGIYAELCRRVKNYYPRFDPRIIKPLEAFSKRSGEKLSDLLALCLIESICNPLDKSSESSAFGPFHYLVEGFADLTKNKRLIAELRAITPDERLGALDDFLKRSDKYFKDRSALNLRMVRLRMEARKPIKGETIAARKERLAANKQAMAQAKVDIGKLRPAYRDDVLNEFSDIVLALQTLDVVTKAKSLPFAEGLFYRTHFSGPTGAPILETMRTAEQAAKANGTFMYEGIEWLEVSHLAGRGINRIKGLGNGGRTRVLVDGKMQTVKIEGFALPMEADTFTNFPALYSRLDAAAANHSLFFQPEKFVVEGKGERWLLVPRTADQVIQTIVKRWDERLKWTIGFDNPPPIPPPAGAKGTKKTGFLQPARDGMPAIRFDATDGKLHINFG